jgi:flagellar hook-basal body complex protein FliE
MSIINPILIPATPGSIQSTASQQKTGQGFANELTKALDSLNETQHNAEAQSVKLALGEVEELHEMTVAMEQAKLSLQLAVQVRNKLVEAYQEIARMQV